MTNCGAPWFVSPEVCQSKPYDSKADLWAVGIIIIYELVTLKKPFNSDKTQDDGNKDLYDKIVNHPFEPLPLTTDPNIRNLVSALLKKDLRNRPNIFEVA